MVSHLYESIAYCATTYLNQSHDLDIALVLIKQHQIRKNQIWLGINKNSYQQNFYLRNLKNCSTIETIGTAWVRTQTST